MIRLKLNQKKRHIRIVSAMSVFNTIITTPFINIETTSVLQNEKKKDKAKKTLNYYMLVSLKYVL
jgi:hypothetical protein